MTVPQAVAGTVVGRALRLESDGMEELRMPGCVSIADRHETSAEVALVKFHTLFLPKLSESPLGDGRYCQPPHHSTSSRRASKSFITSTNMSLVMSFPRFLLALRILATQANKAFIASRGGIAAESSRGPSCRFEIARHEPTSHEPVSLFMLLHAVDPLRRGRILSCPRRRLFPRAGLDHRQRLGHVVDVLRPPLLN